eukprot:TRINITY_DN6303_c0_g2_i1.p1 TRINITY_DN6303_c0_g2~~TRINITY_DN6303_c0_g2_i1.p1  ORF type:complete len:1057 (+),score=317.42 TRINITY_DN6303_c0_g2_i1:86-3256(+)
MPTAAKSAASPKKLPQKEKDKEKKNKKEKKEKKADKGEPAEAVPVDAPKDKKEKKDKKDKKAKKDKKQKDALDPTAEVPANEDDAFDAFIDDTEMALPVEPPAEGQRQGNEGDQQEALDNLFADDDLELGEAGLDDVVKETTADAKEYVSTAATITEDASAEPSSSIPNKAERSSITLSKECIGLLTKDDHCLAKRIQRVLNVMLEVRDDSLKVFFDPLPTHEKEQSEAAETMARDVLEAVDNTRSESMTEFSEQTLEKLPATVVQVPEESISDILKEFGSFYPEEFDVILLFGEDSSRKAQEAPLAAGDSVEAKYKEKWYDATVAGLEDDQVKVKYIYNGSVEVLPRDHVRRKEVGQLVRVVLVGNDPRERQAARLKVYRALGPRFSWYFSGAQAPGEELGTEIGLQIFDLRSGWLSKAKNDGVLERVRISCKTCFNCAVEFVNDRAFVSGDRQERDACMALFEVLQSSGDQLDSVPQALENVFLELSLSEEVASKILSQGWGSGNLHTIEEAEKVFIRKLKMDSDGKHRLGIFGGSLRDRLNAKLQLMRVVEAEKPGSFDDQKIALPHDPRFCEPGFETSTQPCGEAEVQQLSSSDGSAWTRRAAAAAHCVAGLVGKTLHLGGTSSERERGFNYIEWMMAALKEEVPKVTVRDDMTVLDMPQEKKKNLPLHVRKHVEEEHEIFSFFSSPIELEAPLASVTARLLLCGHTSGRRASAAAKFRQLQDQAPGVADWDLGWGGEEKSASSSAHAGGKNTDDNDDWGDWKKDGKKSWSNTDRSDSWKSWDQKDQKDQKTSWSQSKSWDKEKSWDKSQDKKDWDKQGSWKKDSSWSSKDKKDSWSSSWKDAGSSWKDKGGGGAEDKQDWSSSGWRKNQKEKGGKWNKRSWGEQDDNQPKRKKWEDWTKSSQDNNSHPQSASSSSAADPQQAATSVPVYQQPPQQLPQQQQYGAAPAAGTMSSVPHQPGWPAQLQAPPEFRPPPGHEADAVFMLNHLVNIGHPRPQTGEEWRGCQDFVFGGHPRLPPGFVRVLSASRGCVYFFRLRDNTSFASLEECYQSP